MTASDVSPIRPLGGLLGDTALRDYSRKLQLFSAFAEPELRALILGLRLLPGMRVLDAGCGTGEALPWLSNHVEPTGTVIGIELAAAHAEIASSRTSPRIQVFQGDLLNPPFEEKGFDLIWCVNTVNHLRNPVLGIKRLARLLGPGGRMAVGQSSLLPDMYFAWNSSLERATNEAVRRYYRDRYGLAEQDLASVRALVGAVRESGLRNTTARTMIIERMSPLDAATEAYLLEAIFQGTWGARLRPYLSEEDYAELARVCDPAGASFALQRQDFHFLQSFTLVTAEI